MTENEETNQIELVQPESDEIKTFDDARAWISFLHQYCQGLHSMVASPQDYHLETVTKLCEAFAMMEGEVQALQIKVQRLEKLNAGTLI